MQHILQLAIPKPCHENWEEMTREQQGRFCNACATTVIDFTNMSDGELLNFFKDKRSGDYCGRILPQQLDRSLQEAVSRKIPLFYMLLIFLVLFLFSRQANAKAQSSLSPDIYSLPFNGIYNDLNNLTVLPGIQIHNSRAVSGKIFSYNGQTIAGAEVKMVNGKSSFITKQNGSFVFLVEEAAKQIQISAPGFETKMLTITNEDYYEITLQPLKQICPPRPEIMGKIVIRKPQD